MALSAYATDKRMNEEYYKKIRGLVSVDNNGTFEMDLSFFMHFLQDQSGYSSSKLIQLIGPTRENNDELTERHYAIAHAVQKVTEDILTQMLNWLYEQTGLERVTVSGGTFMNSLFNGKIRDKTDFKEVFISSCPDDIGTSIGAALYVYNHLLGNKKRYVQKHNYYGPEFSNNEVRETLDRYKVKYESVDNITEYTAKLLAEGYLIGWFQGRMEYGERALGNRSILADPRDSSMKDKINAAVKYRESFRPFAPSILYEKTGEYFEIPDSVGVPFMEQICKVKKEKQEEIPAVVHKDGTGRLQTVKKDINARFYDLIKSFYGITGVPVVLNTSFNLNGEPIVCSPNDAIRTFYTCGLDYLVMGNYVIKK
jgi:carbamoyltransferase